MVGGQHLDVQSPANGNSDEIISSIIDNVQTKSNFSQREQYNSEVFESEPSLNRNRVEQVVLVNRQPINDISEIPLPLARRDSDISSNLARSETKSRPLPSGSRPIQVAQIDKSPLEKPPIATVNNLDSKAVVGENIFSRQGIEEKRGERLRSSIVERQSPKIQQTTVRVNIGRIEILSPQVPSSPSPRPAVERRPPSTLKPTRSLDDYLSRPSGGKK